MVIEFLTFSVHPDERAAWMEVEEQAWSRFLERQPGFVRKQLWIDVDDPGCVHAMIEWESMDAWTAIPHHELEAVDASMGPWFRDCTCRTFEVLRNC